MKTMCARSNACDEVLRDLTSYMEGAQTAGGRARTETHLAACPTCRRFLAEWTTLVGSLGRLEDRGADAGDAEKARLLALFREQAPLPGRPRHPGIPLGLGDAFAAPGDHLAYFWETEEEFLGTAGFVAAGADQGETAVILCHDEAHDRIAAAMRRRGLETEALQREQRLHFVPGARSADGLLEEVGALTRSAVDRGAPLVRILGLLGWGQRGSPEDQELIRLEARVTEAVEKLPVVVACTFEVPRVPGPILMRAGLECHPLVHRRDTLRHNPLYLPCG